MCNLEVGMPSVLPIRKKDNIIQRNIGRMKVADNLDASSLLIEHNIS
jgi:hypothetical protein